MTDERPGDTEKTLRDNAAYWCKTLENVPSLFEFATDRPRPARSDNEAVVVELDECLTAGMKTLSERHRSTLFETALAP